MMMLTRSENGRPKPNISAVTFTPNYTGPPNG